LVCLETLIQVNCTFKIQIFQLPEVQNKLLIALGGNALLDSKSKGTIEEKESASDNTSEQLLGLLSSDYNVILTHGNGPQVGNLLIQNEEASKKIPPMPLDVCVSETQGEIGYILQKSIQNILNKYKIKKNVVTILTQVIVDKKDIAFENPSKPVGPYYTSDEAKVIIQQKGWKFIEDPAGKGYRRVVPSPKPIGILQAKIINDLAESGNIVIAVGGGGIPVSLDENNHIEGIEAVIDKDYASARLAIDINADEFIIMTNIDKCYLNFNKPNQIELKSMNLDEASTYLEQGHFSSGSMGPKVGAAMDYVINTGKNSIITNIENLMQAIENKEGTLIHP
jgi:carbamate kinase